MRNPFRRTSGGAGCLAMMAVLPLAVSSLTGCAVGQRPGLGTCLHLREPKTGGWYWMYLPVGYDEPAGADGSRVKRPLVVTFHGMKPFDDAHRQIREWQQEADRYGFVVCAPELLVSDLFGPLPLSDQHHPSLKRDEERVIAIMDHVYRTTDVDPNRALATSWSYGGYVAHYMANRHPERFHCIAVKQSNFDEDLLDPANVPRYRDRKVAIYYTENDFAICRRESKRAAEWYAKHGFDLTYGVFEKKGHERTPSVAAEFFGRVCGIEAKSPPLELAGMQIKLEHVGAEQPDKRKFAPSRRTGASAGHGVQPRADSTVQPSRGGVEVALLQRSMAAESTEGTIRTNSDPTRERADRGRFDSGARVGPARGVTLKSRPVSPREADRSNRRAVTRIEPARQSPVRVRVSSTIGVAPLLVSYSAVIPANIRDRAHLLWTENGQPLSNGLNGQKVFTEPGDHTLEVRVTAPDGSEHRASRIINVIERVQRRPR